MKMIAKAIKGKEFFYSRESAHRASDKGAAAICDALNSLRYQLRDGEIWHVYDCGWYETQNTGTAYQAFTRRAGKIYDKRI